MLIHSLFFFTYLYVFGSLQCVCNTVHILLIQNKADAQGELHLLHITIGTIC